MKNKFKKINNSSRGSVYLPLIIVGLVILVIGAFFVWGMVGQSSSAAALATDNRVNIEKPKSQQAINKVMHFPLKDDEGKEVAKLKYEILSSELRNEIIVKGQKAEAVKGRTFLVINIKITNDYDKPVELRARDYIRLVVSGSKEKLAPEIHNDPVEVQALSTKYTRLGFPINDTEKNLTLLVGEIGGKKEEIKLNLN
jgi:hypothetical protein